MDMIRILLSTHHLLNYTSATKPREHDRKHNRWALKGKTEEMEYLIKLSAKLGDETH